MTGPVHAVLSNGDHGFSGSAALQAKLRDFLDFYVKGVDNGYGERPRVEVWWETQGDKSCPVGDGWNPPTCSTRNVEPRWVTECQTFPGPAVRPTGLFLSSGGTLTAVPGVSGADTYTYVGGTGQYRGNDFFPFPTSYDFTQVDPSRPALPTATDWSAPPDDDKREVYTSAPLDKDLAAVGSGSLDLWLSSSAVDTDLQAVLTEVRPDGQEVYVQTGWLRASHRAEDPTRTTAQRPFHSHQLEDVELLEPGQPTSMRVEIRPFAHLFRKGSSIRVSVEAPARHFNAWTLYTLPGPAVNTVHHGSLHPSVLWLPALPGHAAPVDHPVCGTVLRQPCRA